MNGQKVYLDDNGNPIDAGAKVYLDDRGNPISAAPAVTGEGLDSRDSRRFERTPESHALEAADFGQNLLGMGQAVGRVVTTAGQWIQDLPRQARGLSAEKGLGNKLRYVIAARNTSEPSHVTPTPDWLEPKTPGQKLGSNVASVGLYAAPAIATGGASLPAQIAAGGVGSGLVAASQGDNPEVAATLGSAAPLAGAGTQRAVKRVRQWAQEKEIAERIWNRVAGVPAGRKGVSISMSTGETVTNPGKAMVRSSEKKGLGQVVEAGLARPDPALRQRANAELQRTSQELESHLALSSDVTLNIDLPLVPRAEQAVRELKIPMDKLTGRVQVTPIMAKKLKSELGDRIVWSETALATEQNEAMKDAYFAISDAIEKNVPGAAKLMRPWRESYLFQRALRHRLEQQAAGQNVPGSMIGETIKKALPYGAGGAGILGAYEVLKGR